MIAFYYLKKVCSAKYSKERGTDILHYVCTELDRQSPLRCLDFTLFRRVVNHMHLYICSKKGIHTLIIFHTYSIIIRTIKGSIRPTHFFHGLNYVWYVWYVCMIPQFWTGTDYSFFGFQSGAIIIILWRGFLAGFFFDLVSLKGFALNNNPHVVITTYIYIVKYIIN